MQEIDFFICHASEDKEDFVRPFAHYIIKNEASVFYDEFSIKLGDSLSEKINQGLSQCKCAIVVLSKHFFEKSWTTVELQGIFQKHISQKAKLIILYHEISHDDVLEKAPLLADIYAVNTSAGIPEITRMIFEATGFQPSLKYITQDLSDASPDIACEGFASSLRFQLNVINDPYIEKYIAEYGDPSNPHGRISLYIRRNQFLVAAFTDIAGRSVSLQTSVEPFINRPQVLTAQISTIRQSIELYVGGELATSFNAAPQEFIQSFVPTQKSIYYNSFDLVNPTPMSITFFAISSELSPEGIKAFHGRITELGNTLESVELS